MPDLFPEHLVAARNTARDASGSIHDDTAARVFGYGGGLVPGVTLHAYMAHAVAEAWGLGWVGMGTMASRSRRPVYDGELVRIIGTLGDGADRPEQTVDLQTVDQSGIVRATGRATFSPQVAATPPAHDVSLLPLSKDPPVAEPGALRVGYRFGSAEVCPTAGDLAAYLDQIGETYRPYRKEGIFPPTYLQEVGFSWEHVSFAYLTPVIYVSSWAQHYRPVHVGDRLRGNGEITALYERKGNHYMDLEQVVVANEGEIVARVERTTIYRARTARGARA